jgi:hypothetical protein
MALSFLERASAFRRLEGTPLIKVDEQPEA